MESKPDAVGAPLAQYSRGMERLVVAVQELALARDLATIMAIVRQTARELTGADGATFILREGDLCYYADEEAIAPLWKGRRFPLPLCISGWVMQHREPAVIDDIYQDPRIPVDAYRPTFVTSLVMVPIRTPSPIGAIGNYWAARHVASLQDVHLLQALADTTSVAMENVQVYATLEQRVQERTEALQQALSEIKTLRGLIPICAHCKKIRDHTGEWQPVELYVQAHTDAQFSHGICPPCTATLYPDLGREGARKE